jgi:hypothetical protein
VGNLRVFVPADADVTVHGKVGAGDLDLFGVVDGGTGVDKSVRSQGPGPEPGPQLLLTLHGGVGRVEVHRGAP